MDPFQVPPVKHEDCIPFRNSVAWDLPTWQLSNIMRQKEGNPIIEFVTLIRDNPFEEHYDPKEHLLDNGTGISLVDEGSQRESALLKELFTDQAFKKDSDFMKVIAWRNATVNKYNDIIRSIIYPQHEHLLRIMQGEKLIMEKPYVINPRSLLTKNDEIEVKTVSTLNKQITWTDAYGIFDNANFKFYQVGIEWYTERGMKQGHIPIIHDDSLPAFAKLIDSLKQMALSAPADKRSRMWRQYYKTIGESAWTKYNYSITTHLSQGSTYKQSIVLQWDILANKKVSERNRILYTACTRASDTLFIEA
jgi:hypothetical protein